MDGIHEATIGDYQVTTVVNGLYRENSYILLNRARAQALVIDPGGRADDIAELVERTAGVVVDAVLLTHGHFDHLGAAHALSERWNVPCRVHSGDQKLIRQAPLYALRLIRAMIQVPKRLETFEELAALDWAGGSVGILQTPGHTVGSVCFVVPGMVFTGDCLLREHVGPTIYPGSNGDVLKTSIDGLLAGDLRDQTAIFPGHGRPWTMGEARMWWSRLDGPPPPYSIHKAS